MNKTNTSLNKNGSAGLRPIHQTLADLRLAALPRKPDPLKQAVIAARNAYRATLDAAGRGSEDAYRAMEAAEAEWDAAPEESDGSL